MKSLTVINTCAFIKQIQRDDTFELGRTLTDNLASIDSVNQSLTRTRKLFRRSDEQRYMMFKYKFLFTNYVVVNECVQKAFVTVIKQHVGKLC